MAKPGAPSRKKEPKMLTVTEVAKELKLSDRTIRRYIADGWLRIERVGPRNRITGKGRHIRIAELEVELFKRNGPPIAQAS